MKNYDDEIKNLNDKLKILDDRLTKLENNPQEKKPDDAISEFTESIVKNIDKIPTKDLAILSLKNFSSQSIMKIEESLLNIGWVKDTFFTKNFATELAKKGLVQPSGKDERGKNTYSLTARGKIYADDLLKKLEKKFQ